MPSLYTASIQIGGSFDVNDLSIMHFAYKVMWDRGSRLDLLIHDPNAQLHAALEGMAGDPTPKVTFRLAWEPSIGRSGGLPENRGSKHTLYILRAGLVTTPQGLAIRIKAVDAGSIKLRNTSLSYYAGGVKASQFIQGLCQQVGIKAQIPDTGDVAFVHNALNVKPIDHIRYELDRVLSSGGAPISVQFDDSDKQMLVGFEELYGGATTPISGLAGDTYTFGPPNDANNARISSYNSTAYHFEMEQDFRPAAWGHQVSINHLTNAGAQVTGEVKSKLSSKLGIQGEMLGKGMTRLQMPAGHIDSPTSDEYFAKAIMTNTVFQSEMCITSGYAMIDADFLTYDGVALLNRKHATIAVTGGDNRKTGNSLVPVRSVIMGYEHRLNRNSAFTKLFVRRG